jgi:CHAD domain-containing protein
MYYQVYPEETFPSAFHRIFGHELSQIHNLLDQPQQADLSIHETRKAVKRLRALLRFSQAWLPKKRSAEENIFLRDFSRQLSDFRDRQVLSDSLRTLAASLPGKTLPKAVSSLADEIQSSLNQEISACLLPEGLFAQLASAAAAHPAHVQELYAKEASVAQLITSLQRIYRQGKRAMRKAAASPEAELRHEWRKRVKELSYALQLLRAGWPALTAAIHKEVSTLDECLGKDHDLAVLADFILASDRPSVQTGQRKAQILAEISARREELFQKALEAGSQVYILPPALFASCIARSWVAKSKQALRSAESAPANLVE